MNLNQAAPTIDGSALEEFRRSHPGFSSAIVQEMAPISKQYDVVFSGPAPAVQSHCCAVLAEVAKVPLTVERPTSLAFFIGDTGTSTLPAGICMNAREEVRGMDMLRALARAKIVLDVGRGSGSQQLQAIPHVHPLSKGGHDLDGIRIFEATAVGSLLLTDDSEAASYFQPGLEMVLFGTVAELKEKINFYLDHDREREEIARRGQQRCLSEYLAERHAVQHVVAPKRVSLMTR